MKRVHIISKPVLKDFALKQPQSEELVWAWWELASKSSWFNWAEVKQCFQQVDKVEDKLVFNLGERYRLICRTHFGSQRCTLFILWVGPHKAYDKLDLGKL